MLKPIRKMPTRVRQSRLPTTFENSKTCASNVQADRYSLPGNVSHCVEQLRTRLISHHSIEIFHNVNHTNIS